LKILVISDTHGQHHKVTLISADMIIHAGDVTKSGRYEEVIDFLNWFSHLDYTYKIFIAGNHDFYFEDCQSETIKGIMPPNVIYLNDSGVEINGVHIWGSPIQPWFYDWAFNRKRGTEIAEHWGLIPVNTDLLITHGPPLGVLDKTVSGDHVGCQDLLSAINDLKLKYHVFGHIHESYGIHESQGGTCSINASVLNEKYHLQNKPITFDISE
jgi:Icc-related predicted phosphoesterase